MIFEPNDTINEANDTGLTSDNPGSFVADGFIGDSPNIAFAEDDVDFFQVQLDAGDSLTIDIDAEINGSFLDSILRLFDSEGNEVAVSDDDPAPGEPFLLDSFISFNATASDTYFIGVSSFSNFDYDPFVADSGFGSGGSTGEYTINIDLIAGMDGFEPDDTINEANDTGLTSDNPGSFVADSFIGDSPNIAFAEDDVDFFQVQLDAGDRITIDIDTPVSSLDSILRLFDSEGNEVAVNDDFNGLDSFISFNASVSDNYFIGVSSFSNFNYDPFVADSGFGGSTGEYTINIDLIAAINGTEGNDVLIGTPEDDIISGLGANDVLQGESGNDFLSGGIGNDTIGGADGNDSLLGEDGDDILDGGDDLDKLLRS